MKTTALDRPHRSTHGGDADRRWHLAHGNGTRCDACWPGSGGLPPMPDNTAVYPTPVADWLIDLIRAEFGDDTEEVTA
jgi:hypothetical protein